MKAISSLVATALLLATAASAQAEQYEYHLTGDYAAPAGVRAELQASSFLIQGNSFGSNGSQDFQSAPIDRVVPELFSTDYAGLQTFGYFGLIDSFDGDDNLVDEKFYIAAKAGSLTGMAFADVFADYLTDHPFTLPAFIDMIRAGPDFPGPGEGTDWIAFNDSRFGLAPFAGAIATNFQPGDTLELFLFDNTTTQASSFGTFAVAANVVPEPTSMGLVVAPLLGALARRRR